MSEYNLNGEGNENIENSEGIENTGNTENTENIENIENIENSENIENIENIESIEINENAENIESSAELKRRYGEVMDSIAEDIHQINLNPDDDLSEVFGDSVSESTESDDFIKSISDLDYDDPDEVLSSINSPADTSPIFDDALFSSEFGSGDLEINTGDGNDMLNVELYDNEPDSLTCDECRDLLYDYVSDITSEDENRVIENHLGNCEMCRLELDDIRDMISVMRTSSAPAPPSDLIAGVHDRLAAIAPEIKAESKELRTERLKNAVENAKNVFSSIGAKTNYFIKHANWRIVAPAALSAVLVIGVASSGLYQVMKSSDEIYNFSDNAALADAQTTAKPSASGLDDYVGENGKATNSGSSSESSKNGTSTSGSSSSTSPKTTARPSTSSSGLTNGLTIGGTTGNSSSSSTSKSTTGSSSSSSTNKSTTGSSSTGSMTSSTNRSTTSGSTTSSTNRSTTSGTTTSGSTTSSTNRSTTGSTTSNSSSSSAATKSYVTPNIILPDISSVINNSSTSEAAVEPEITIPEDFDSAESRSSNDSSATTPTSAPGGTASGGGSAGAPVPAVTPTPTAKPAPKPATAVLPTMTPAPSSAPKATAGIAATVSEADRVRNADGETELYTQKKSEMEDASVVNCTVSDSELYNSIINSSYADCSKLEENGDVILYLTSDEFAEFSKVLNGNHLNYSLTVLGKNDSVEVLISASDVK